MVLALALGIASAVLAVGRWLGIFPRLVSIDALAVQLEKLVAAGNSDRARKLCGAAQGTSFGRMCGAALEAFLAEPGGEVLAASAAAERAFEEEYRRQAALLAGLARLLTLLAVPLGLAAIGLALPHARARGADLVLPIAAGVAGIVLSLLAERRAGAILRESRQRFAPLLAALGAVRGQELEKAARDAENQRRTQQAQAVAARERAERAVREEQEHAAREAREAVQREADIRAAAEALAAASRTLCRFCERPYPSSALSCPHCGGPAPR